MSLKKKSLPPPQTYLSYASAPPFPLLKAFLLTVREQRHVLFTRNLHLKVNYLFYCRYEDCTVINQFTPTPRLTNITDKCSNVRFGCRQTGTQAVKQSVRHSREFYDFIKTLFFSRDFEVLWVSNLFQLLNEVFIFVNIPDNLQSRGLCAKTVLILQSFTILRNDKIFTNPGMNAN